MFSTVCATYFSQILPMAKSSPSLVLTHLHSSTIHMLYLAIEINRLVWKQNLIGTSSLSMRTVSQPPLSSPQVSRRNLFSMCQGTEQMNPDLTNLFNSSGVLRQMAFKGPWTSLHKTRRTVSWFFGELHHIDERYENKLPWKSEIQLENNFYSALNQVENLNTSLQRKPLLQEKYNKTLLTDLEKNSVKPVEMQDPNQTEIGTCHTILWKISTSPEKSAELQIPLQNAAPNRLIQTFLQDQISSIIF